MKVAENFKQHFSYSDLFPPLKSHNLLSWLRYPGDTLIWSCTWCLHSICGVWELQEQVTSPLFLQQPLTERIYVATTSEIVSLGHKGGSVTGFLYP